MHIAFIIIVILIVILFWVSRKEGFSNAFTQAAAPSDFLQYLDLGDHSTMVQLQRGDNGKTVLLLHNSPMNLDIWQPLFHTMQRINYVGNKTPNLVAYDLRGHGTAWLPVDPKYNDPDTSNYAWPIEQFVSDCRKVYDQVINSGKIIICGFGFGGLVAQKFALTFPDLIEKVVLLQTTIKPMPGLLAEMNYLAGPNGWIAKNPHVTYLTGDTQFLQQTLCQWFVLPHDPNCGIDTLIDTKDKYNDETTPQYNLAAKLWRQGSCTSLLQTDKLIYSTDIVSEWAKATNLPFTVHILAADDDPNAPPSMMVQTYTSIYNTNRNMLVVFDIVNGRRGFTIMRPDYIASILCGNCIHINAEDTYSPRAKDHGF